MSKIGLPCRERYFYVFPTGLEIDAHNLHKSLIPTTLSPPDLFLFIIFEPNYKNVGGGLRGHHTVVRWEGRDDHVKSIS